MSGEFAWVQLVSSASLTLMGLTVSIVAATFTYRNNFGWRPIVLVTSIGLSSGDSELGTYNALVDVEVWNRRKYPLIIRGVSVKIDGLDLIDERTPGKRDWHLYRNTLVLNEEYTIAPQTREKHRASAPFERRSLDEIKCPIIVEVLIFDPRMNKTETFIAQGLYSFNTAHQLDRPRSRWINYLSN
jgi:hypothetical protein